MTRVSVDFGKVPPTPPEPPAFERALDIINELTMVIEGELDDLSECDYRRGVGTCNFGCSQEPDCMNSAPNGGWPAERAKMFMEDMGYERDRGIE